jgi:hypothetical protein
MFTKQLSGTRAEIAAQIRNLSIPIEVLAPDAVRNYAIAHIPGDSTGRYKLVLTVHSIHNQTLTTLAGHISVVVTY